MDESDFLCSLAAAEDEVEAAVGQYHAAFAAVLERWLALRAPVRAEWDAGWKELGRATAPVWKPWDEARQREERAGWPWSNPRRWGPGDNDGPVAAAVDAPAAVDALRRIAAAATDYDAQVVQARWVVYRGIRARLRRVFDNRGEFTNPHPCLAATLLLSAFAPDPDRTAAVLGEVLGRDGWRPAVGWLPYLRDCLWPPPDEVRWAGVIEAGSVWPREWQPAPEDVNTLRQLLGPETPAVGSDGPLAARLRKFADRVAATAAMDGAYIELGFSPTCVQEDRPTAGWWKKARELAGLARVEAPDAPVVTTPTDRRDAADRLVLWARTLADRLDAEAADSAQGDLAEGGTPPAPAGGCQEPPVADLPSWDGATLSWLGQTKSFSGQATRARPFFGLLQRLGWPSRVTGPDLNKISTLKKRKAVTDFLNDLRDQVPFMTFQVVGDDIDWVNHPGGRTG